MASQAEECDSKPQFKTPLSLSKFTTSLAVKENLNSQFNGVCKIPNPTRARVGTTAQALYSAVTCLQAGIMMMKRVEYNLLWYCKYHRHLKTSYRFFFCHRHIILAYMRPIAVYSE